MFSFETPVKIIKYLSVCIYMTTTSEAYHIPEAHFNPMIYKFYFSPFNF